MHLLKSRHYIILILTTLNCLVYCERETIFAAILYRHGDRTPIDPYPNDPFRNESLWPVKFGELTNTGKMQHFHLGQWLRKRYEHLLSLRFDSQELYVHSTDVDRTLMSAEVNLAGMYPPISKDLWDKNLQWQPIPIHTIPSKYDNLLSMKQYCPTYENEKKSFFQSPEYKKKLTEIKNLTDYVSENTGVSIENFDDLEYVYNTLFIESLYNFTLPKWAYSVYPDVLKGPACFSFKLPTYTNLMKRLRSGPLIKDIIQHMHKIKRNLQNNIFKEKKFLKLREDDLPTEPSPDNPFKLVIYSGHDTTVANLLNSLGVFDGECPSYTATVMMELIKEKKDLYVSISYRNTWEIKEPVILDIPNCGKLCPLDKFNKLYQHIIPENWNDECNPNKMPYISIMTGFVLLAFSITFVTFFFHFKWTIYKHTSHYSQMEPKGS